MVGVFYRQKEVINCIEKLSKLVSLYVGVCSLYVWCSSCVEATYSKSRLAMSGSLAYATGSTGREFGVTMCFLP